MKFQLKPLEKETNVLKKIRNKLVRNYIYTPKRKSLRKIFLKTLPTNSEKEDISPRIHCLLCRRDLEMGICTFKNLNFLSGINFTYVIHDDGSLTTKDINLLNKHLNVIIHSKEESDAVASIKLKAYPNIVRFRNSHVLALKLIDVIIFSMSTRVAYLDSDILFFEKPDFFLETLLNEKTSLNYFNKDFNDAYIDTTESIFTNLGTRPMPNINAGLWVMNSEDLSLNLLEKWLSNKYLSAYLGSYRLEQTLVALLAETSTSGSTYFPESYDINLLKLPETCVSKHYVGKIRHGFELEGIKFLLNKYHPKV